MLLRVNIVLIMITLWPQISGIITNVATPKSNCNGSISIAYEVYEGDVATIMLEERKSKYPNIRKGFPVLKDGFILYIELFGDCCWKIYSKRNFRGETKIMYPNEDIFYVDFQPVSIKRMIECV